MPFGAPFEVGAQVMDVPLPAVAHKQLGRMQVLGGDDLRGAVRQGGFGCSAAHSPPFPQYAYSTSIQAVVLGIRDYKV